jgi:hypothetical protein
MHQSAEQQLLLPLIEVEEVFPDFYVADLWSDALRRRARRLARIRARRGVAVPVTPPLSPMGGTFDSSSVIS